MSRLTPVREVEVLPAARPFANFDFVDDRFQGSFPIRRLFSQARSRGYRTIVLEEVAAAGAVADENAEIRRLFPDHTMSQLCRISFWRTVFADKGMIAN